MRARFRNLSVGWRVAGGFATVVVLLGMVVAVAFGSLTALDGSAAKVNRESVPDAALAAQLRFHIADLMALQSNYVLDGGASRSAFEARAREVQHDLVDLAGRATGPREQALLAKVHSEITSFERVDGLVWDAVQAGNVDLARNLVLGPDRLAFNYLQADTEVLADLVRVDQAEAVAGFSRTLAQSRARLLALGVTAVLTALLLGSVIARRIRDPLAELEVAAHRAAAGDLSVAVVAHAQDETGRVVRAFNDMVSSLRRSVDDAEYDNQLRSALEMADTEPDVLRVVEHAMAGAAGDLPAEFLMADSSKAHLRRVVVTGPEPDRPCCPVDSPFSCAAVRSGQTAIFRSSRELGACPKLKDRSYGDVSAACVPVTFMGRAVGVVHTVGPDGAPPEAESVARLHTLATQAGSRIGTVRAFERSHLQAATDPLTGLLNRRSFESRLHELELARVPYSLVLCDLDHFKRLNDTHGHDTGDRALRLFARTLLESVRPHDVCARVGGEELVVVLPYTAPDDAEAVAQRIRMRLAEHLTAGDLPLFTVSIGIADSQQATSFEETFRLADDALYRAKGEGRDRVVVSRHQGPGRTPSAVKDHVQGMYSRMHEPDPVLDTPPVL